MKNYRLQKETLTSYCAEIINEWFKNNPYSNASDDDLLFDYCLDMVCETFGDDYKEDYIYNIVDESIRNVIECAEIEYKWSASDNKAVYEWILEEIEQLIDVEPACIEDFEYVLSEIMELVYDGQFLAYTDEMSEDFYRPLVEKAINEYKGKSLISDRNNSIDEMVSDLEEFYECAGFADFYNRVLRKMSNSQIVDYWKQTFDDAPGYAM